MGLDLDTMARLNREVLDGGFHMVKDDELQVFADDEAFRAHVAAMVAARDAASARTGERKAYLANLICEPGELEARWRIACDMGADAVLVEVGFISHPVEGKRLSEAHYQQRLAEAIAGGIGDFWKEQLKRDAPGQRVAKPGGG